MTRFHIWRAVLIVVLCAALAAPARAQYGPGKIVSNGVIAGVIAGVAAAVTAVIIVVVHSKRRAITGCVGSSADGLTITDEKNKQVYQLSGNTTGIKAGDRVKLRGKKVKSNGPDVGWNTKAEVKDFGVCQP